MVLMGLPGGWVELERDALVQVRAAAAAEAGWSSAARDLSLILERALRQARPPVALRRRELQTLIDVATRLGRSDLVAALEHREAR
jgi:hypothetical protein